MTLPLIPFNFEVNFFQDGRDVPLCAGAFSEVSGIEATMEPRVIRQGGQYNGEVQRAGQITYATVILKHGITAGDHLWRWFDLIASGKTAARLRAELIQFALEPGEGGAPKRVNQLHWVMENALPTKFKAATYSAMAAEVGVEELQFVHERLQLRVGGAS